MLSLVRLFLLAWACASMAPVSVAVEDDGLGFQDHPLITPQSPSSHSTDSNTTAPSNQADEWSQRQAMQRQSDPRPVVDDQHYRFTNSSQSHLDDRSNQSGPRHQDDRADRDELPAHAEFQLDQPADDLLWLDRRHHAPRLGANLISEQAVARPPSIDHRLRPGDLLRIVGWGGATLNESIPVDAAGNLAVPGFGVVPVSGLTQAQAQERLVELLRSHFRNAGAVVAVESAADQAVIVTGEVEQPGYLRLPPGGTVLEALAAAGGVRAVGSLRQIQIREPGQTARALDLYPLILNGAADALTPLAPGTSIHVPLAAVQVDVFGAVRRANRIEVSTGTTLAVVLDAAGGLLPGADPSTLRLARETDSGLAMQLLTQEDLANVPTHDGDRLFVSLRHDADGARAVVTIDGAIRTPGPHAYRNGMTVGDLVTAAGGLRPGADASDIVIRRVLPEPVLMELASGLKRPVFHDLLVAPSMDTPLVALDHLTVPLGAVLEDQLASVSISGAVVEPGHKPLVPGMTMKDLLAIGGGLLPNAQVDHADLVRVMITDSGERSVKRSTIDLRPILNGESLGPELVNFDVVVIRSRADERVRVTIEGEVLNTGELVLPGGTTLSQAIAIAGGLTERAFPGGAQFFRLSEKQAAEAHLADLARRLESSITINEQQLNQVDDADGEREIRQTLATQQAELTRMQQASATGRMAGIRLPDILSGELSHDFELRDGDRLVIPARPGTVRVLGEVMVPGSLRHEADVAPLEAIQRSGGLTRQADEDLIFVVRADGSVVASAAFSGTSWDPEERRWVRTKLKNIELAEGDTVIVPPDLRYRPGARVLARDWSQVLFQIAGAVGTIAVLSN